MVSVRYIQQDLDQLLTKYPLQTPLKREITHLKIMTKELTHNIATLEQILPGTNRSKRGILSIVGKALKFLFGTALSEDIVRLDQKFIKYVDASYNVERRPFLKARKC